MINKKPTPKIAALKTIIFLPVLAIALFAFTRHDNNRDIPYEADQSGVISGIVPQVNEKLFSDASTMKILKFLAENSVYPQGAKNALDTGKVFISVKVNKGGKIREAATFIDKKDVKVPVLNEEIVIIGYMPSDDKLIKPDLPDDHTLLRSECLRLANKLEEIDIPEWTEQNLEFAVAIKFVLKPALTTAPGVYNDNGSNELISPK